jgi:alpha-galactosidase
MACGTESEFATLSDWCRHRFSFKSAKHYRCAQMQVNKQKWGPCAINQSMHRTPLFIGKKKFARGLAVHAISEVVVSLPSPGKIFKASIGQNQSIVVAGNKTRIAFVVTNARKELYRSPVLQGGEPPLEIAVPLKKTREFIISVEGSEEWAHADWAEARVELENGQTIWLDELPFSGGLPVCQKEPPFSFIYDGKPSKQFIDSWNCNVRTETIDDLRIRHTVTYADPLTNLEVGCEAIIYRDYPAVEWVVHVKNNGKKDTPILENIQALDMALHRGNHDCEFVLHHAVGSICAERDFAPLEQRLLPQTEFKLAPLGGRSSSGTLPFFNIESAGGGGVIGAIGWSGQWQAVFQRDAQGELAVRAGMELTHLKLHPGESVRTPSILLLFWRGADRVRCQNMWRSLMLKHYTPQPSGRPLQPPIAFASWGMFPEKEMVRRITILKNAGLPLDCFWVDAGWFGDCQKEGDWYPQAGNWYANPSLFPQGLSPVSNVARRHNCKFLLWFDVERVYKDTQIHREHPEWLLDLEPALQVDPNTGTAFQGCDQNFLLNLGNPAARRWITDHLSKIIDEAGVDILREDFNFDPLLFWRKADTPDRQGITEIKYIEGLYAFLDELLKRHPRLAIDNCASGGRRLDLEMTRRSIPLWRSDLQCSADYSALGSQSQTFGIASWLPLNCAGSRAWLDTYDFRSALSSGCIACWASLDHPENEWGWAKKMLEEASLLRPLFQGNFYPLTPYGLGKDVWLAYQLDRPDLEEGAVMAYRREQCPHPIAVLKLRALAPDAHYEIRNFDSDKIKQMTGRALMEKGLKFELKRTPDSSIVCYKKIN